MGLLTSVKETVLGGNEVGEAGGVTDEVGEVSDERSGESRSPIAAVETTGQGRSAEECASEADLVVATGRSREDALVELVEVNGGRVKQSELVELTGWSKATVSRHLSGLEADGAIDRVPVGRQKVVLLPDESLLDESLGPDDADGGSTSDSTYPST